jgi:porin
MSRTQAVLVVTFLLGLAGLCRAQGESIWEQETLTNGFWGLNDRLANSGIELGFGITSIYQINAHGGAGTNNRRGRHSGSYDLELSADLQKWLGFKTGSIYTLVEGGWPDAEGIDAASVGSAFGVNADAVGNQGPVVKELYYQGPVFGNSFTIMVGKIDFTGVFDATDYADDECTQFLNAAFVDDPTIPFPDYSLGVVLTYDLTDSWYLMGGIADAQANGRETGFKTTFGDEDYFFYVLETGTTAGNGTYRVGLWNDPQPKGSDNKRDDVGVYTSCDWILHKENADQEDNQGLGGFFRYGCAPSRKNDITNFFSLGLQYQGLFDSRDDDVFGLAYARGVFADRVASDYPADYESVLEAYYNAQITPWFVFGPSIQYVTNPTGGEGSTSKDAIVFGLRAQVTF